MWPLTMPFLAAMTGNDKHTDYGDDWEMVYGIVMPTLYMFWPNGVFFDGIDMMLDFMGFDGTC